MKQADVPHYSQLDAVRAELAAVSSALAHRAETLKVEEEKIRRREEEVRIREEVVQEREFELKRGEDEVLAGARRVAEAQIDTEAAVKAAVRDMADRLRKEHRAGIEKIRARAADADADVVRLRSKSVLLQRTNNELETKLTSLAADLKDRMAQLGLARKRIAKLEHKLVLSKAPPSQPSQSSSHSPQPLSNPPRPSPSPSKPSPSRSSKSSSSALAGAGLQLAAELLLATRDVPAIPPQQLMALAPSVAGGIKAMAGRSPGEREALLKVVLEIQRASLTVIGVGEKPGYSVRKLGDEVFDGPALGYLEAEDPHVACLAALAVIGSQTRLDRVAGALSILRPLVQTPSVRSLLMAYDAADLFLSALCGASDGTTSPESLLPLWRPLSSVLAGAVAEPDWIESLANEKWASAFASALPLLPSRSLESISLVLQNLSALSGGRRLFVSSGLKGALSDLLLSDNLSDFVVMNLQSALSHVQ